MTDQPWVCTHCHAKFPVDSMCREHEPTCVARPDRPVEDRP